MKINKESKVAVDVYNCTKQEKEKVVDAMLGFGIRKGHYITDSEVVFISMNFGSGCMGRMSDYDDGKAFYPNQGHTILTYDEFMRAVKGEGFDFAKKSIDVRECTAEQKQWINRLLAGKAGVPKLEMNDMDEVAYLNVWPDHIHWNDYDGDHPEWAKEEGITTVHYKDFLKAVNPYGDRKSFVRDTDDEVVQRMFDLWDIYMTEG